MTATATGVYRWGGGGWGSCRSGIWVDLHIVGILSEHRAALQYQPTDDVGWFWVTGEYKCTPVTQKGSRAKKALVISLLDAWPGWFLYTDIILLFYLYIKITLHNTQIGGNSDKRHNRWRTWAVFQPVLLMLRMNLKDYLMSRLSADLKLLKDFDGCFWVQKGKKRNNISF